MGPPTRPARSPGHRQDAVSGTPSHRLFALVSYPDGADPAEVVRAFLASAEQAADMEGFDLSDLVGVEELLLSRLDMTPDLVPDK